MIILIYLLIAVIVFCCQVKEECIQTRIVSSIVWPYYVPMYFAVWFFTRGGRDE